MTQKLLEKLELHRDTDKYDMEKEIAIDATGVGYIGMWQMLTTTRSGTHIHQ